MKDTKITLFQSLFDSKSVPYILTLEQVVDRIKVGKSIDKINAVKKQTTIENYDLYKKKLPVIIFGGVFKHRNTQSLLEHSGLMITDYDKIFSQEEFDRIFNQLKSNPHTVLVFKSPSYGSGVESQKGKGIKSVVRIPKCDYITHRRYHESFENEFKIDYFDSSNKDVVRSCFEVHDPNIYINYDADVYSPELKDEGFKMSEKIPLIPITDEMVIIERIMKWGWNKDFIEGEKNSFIFDLAGAFCEYGVSQMSAEGYLYNHIIAGNCKDEQGKMKTIKSAYKMRSFGSRYFEDYTKIDLIKSDLNKGKKYVVDNHDISEDTYNEIKEEIDHDNFWYYDEKEKLKINLLKYKIFLENSGFKKYYPNNNNSLFSTFVFVESNKVAETSSEKIKDYVLKYLLKNKKLDVWNYCAGYGNLFSENQLNSLDHIDLMMLTDEKEKSYIAFDNGILEITEKGLNMVDYIDVDGYVWRSHIVKRNFKKLKNDDNDFKTFVYNVSSNDPLPIECAIGYLLCRYKNRVNNKAVILNDEIITDNPEGGTGKGIFSQALSQIRNVSLLDGKDFDDKKSFPYQTVSPETSVVFFDDVKKNFNFENMFSIITEGITLERKNKDAIKLNVKDSPKVLISTNYAIRGEGNSHDRRRHEIEISQYYGKNKTPFDDFGMEMFDDWNEDHFLRFDNYMANCIIKYLKNGLIEQESKNKEKRKIIRMTSIEFLEWIEDPHNFPLNIEVIKSTAFNNFTEEYQDFKKWLKRKTFHIWVERYANFKGYTFTDGKSSSGRFFKVSVPSINHKEVSEENNDELLF